MNVVRALGQAAFWGTFMALVVLFAQAPAYAPIAAGHGELKLSLAHRTQRLEPCRALGEDERNALPPNMRVTEICARERAPARIELVLDGVPLLQEAVRPAGWHRDGRAYEFRAWSLPAGAHRLELKLADGPEIQDFGPPRFFEFTLDPGESVLLRLGDGEASLHEH